MKPNASSSAVLWALAWVLLLVPVHAPASDRVPGEHWMRFTDVREAGFDPDRLEQARQSWQTLPSSAFLIVADGAVVASWGDGQRRFMCHSVRKSFMSGLYGIYWDRGEIELNKTLLDLGIDDDPDPLLESEKQARILDLLKARSGVFHPAAYAGRIDSRPRGSEGPGRYFAYNNWDFNTLAAILKQETGADVFSAFDQYFAKPLQMQDWRVSDGYYHYERDKSQFPAYPFRLSARDAARFGLLYARKGQWGGGVDARQIVSRQWIQRSTALYSIDDEVFGYGYMWWVAREPRFARYGMYLALGIGNQMIAVLPELDMVIVNRADTYLDQTTPMKELLDLVEQVLKARIGAPVESPRLSQWDEAPIDARLKAVASEQLKALVGDWAYPPAPLGLPEKSRMQVSAGDGFVTASMDIWGSFKLYPQPDGSLLQEDSLWRYQVVRDDRGAVAGIVDSGALVDAGIAAAAAGNFTRAEALFGMLGSSIDSGLEVGRAMLDLFSGREAEALMRLRRQMTRVTPEHLANTTEIIAIDLWKSGNFPSALRVLVLNTRLFPTRSMAWRTLGDAQFALHQRDAAAVSYAKALRFNPNDSRAIEQLKVLQDAASAEMPDQ